MAERRMFAKSLINSARFLRMPATSRLLYYDLGMAADDDGVVEAFTVMRTTGATEDDLRVLVSKAFVRVLNDDLVSLILDWKQNNLIKTDRYHPSIYSGLLLEISNGTQTEPEWNTNGTQTEPEVSIGEISKVKESIYSPSGGRAAKAARAPAEGFSEFWEAYPRKHAKQAAQAAWDKLRPDAGLRGQILAALSAQKRSAAWREQDGKFIPLPSTYINGRRWEDQILDAAPVPEAPAWMADL